MGMPELARFGSRGYVDGERKRLSIKDVDVTPNHHAIARQWAFSDNFYADSDVSVDGHHWLVGSYPNAWTESSLMAAYSEQKKDFRLGAAPGRLLFAGTDSSVHPEEQLENGTIWHHLERHHITFRNFGEGFELAGVDEGKDLEPTGARFLTNVPMPDPLYRNTSRTYPGFNTNIPDQFRATQFIKEIEENAACPQFVFIHLPNDHTADARPDDGYPYRESYVADNDYALGRIIEYLSGRKEWSETAVFVTEDDAQSGVDHIDAHRTVFMALGPWIRQGLRLPRNTSFPGLLKTIFRLLRLPPLNLYDATATDLSDLFAANPDPPPTRCFRSTSESSTPPPSGSPPAASPAPRWTGSSSLAPHLLLLTPTAQDYSNSFNSLDAVALRDLTRGGGYAADTEPETTCIHARIDRRTDCTLWPILATEVTFDENDVILVDGQHSTLLLSPTYGQRGRRTADPGLRHGGAGARPWKRLRMVRPARPPGHPVPGPRPRRHHRPADRWRHLESPLHERHRARRRASASHSPRGGRPGESHGTPLRRNVRHQSLAFDQSHQLKIFPHRITCFILATYRFAPPAQP